MTGHLTGRLQSRCERCIERTRRADAMLTHGDTVAGADYNFAGLASPATVPASLPRCECGHVLTAHGRYGCEAPCDDDVTSTCACARRKSAPPTVIDTEAAHGELLRTEVGCLWRSVK